MRDEATIAFPTFIASGFTQHFRVISLSLSPLFFPLMRVASLIFKVSWSFILHIAILIHLPGNESYVME